MSLELDPAVAYLFRQMVIMPSGSKVFINTSDSTTNQLAGFHVNNCHLSVVGTRHNALTFQWKEDAENNKYGWKDADHVAVIHPRLELVRPEDKFHYAFAFPPINEDGTPIIVEDELREYQASRYNPKFTAPRHLLCIEALGHAVMEGGFFGAVLPKRWVSNMQYIKWWSSKFATVAKITLPLTAVTRWCKKEDTEYDPSRFVDTLMDYETKKHYNWTHKIPDFFTLESQLRNQAFSLIIWHKTANQDHLTKYRGGDELAFATQRYPIFIAKLPSLHPEHTETTFNKFRRHDWFKLCANVLNSKMKDGKLSKIDPKYNVETGSYSYSAAVKLADPASLRTIRIADSKRPTYLVTDEIPGKMAVQIKPVMPVKLCTYSVEATAALQELQVKSGHDSMQLRRAQTEPNYQPVDAFTEKLRSVSFSEQRDWLLKNLSNAGLVPFMTVQDNQRVLSELKWLNIQLAPIKRTIRVPTEVDGEYNWDVMYDDMDVKATFPLLWDMWMKRAKAMKLDVYKDSSGNKIPCDFQLEDIVTGCVKQSILDSNVMGLGKTIEALFIALMRCQKHTLIVCPSRLIGVWQNEIEDTIASYIRKVPRNWMGRTQDATYRIINYANDCLPQNLRTFNIVSYENLSKVPKDALFFVCLKCKMVTCSPLGRYTGVKSTGVQCPKCNAGKVQKVKALNVKNGLKKYKEKKEKGGKVVDDRFPLENPTMMEESENQWAKIKYKPYQQQQYNSETGHNEFKLYYQEEEKKLHLKWTFSELLRHRFSMIVIEEANYVANPDTNRAQALNHLTARTRIGLTGTPVRGFPKSVCNILNWILRRAVWSEYRPSKGGEDGVRKFEKRYATYVERDKGTPKLIPKINQPELFQQELAPFMIRHTRFEPDVTKTFRPQIPEIRSERLEMDPYHRAYYNLWLEKFSEWWRLKKKEEEGKEIGQFNDLIIKLGYLVNASTIPHFMLDELKTGEGAAWAASIGKYKHPGMVAKFQYCTELIKKNVADGDKTIVFSFRRANLRLGKAWCDSRKPRIYTPKIIDGRVSNLIAKGGADTLGQRSPKQQIVDAFCTKRYDVLWAGIQTLKEGYNIPQANHGIFLDYTWRPTDWEQSLGRMLRPQQKKTVYGVFTTHIGAVDDYMAAWNQLMARSAQEGVDYQQFADFTVEMIPDFKQYADSIVDGTETTIRQHMWEAVEELRKSIEEGSR